MKNILRIFLLVTLAAGFAGCGTGGEKTSAGEENPKMVKKRREDGTLSSVNPVDEDGYVHGVKVNYYEDGKTVHSQVTYEHGRKHGPAIWYFKSGKVGEHTTYYNGRKHGLTKRYFETGEIREEVTYEKGEELPGKKRYDRKGALLEE